ncbi:hypothetical protein PHMEG_00019957 [Phytophthora megakarya]|uniref:RxLR effector protein n=1 Tax=Phytophthora megakarya TaxID=4795 RepID=A0A225VRU6_9STRA|nr:hypothetical protein PHMEG_00019957 [Phytophthora megakarya]
MRVAFVLLVVAAVSTCYTTTSAEQASLMTKTTANTINAGDFGVGGGTRSLREEARKKKKKKKPQGESGMVINRVKA